MVWYCFISLFKHKNKDFIKLQNTTETITPNRVLCNMKMIPWENYSNAIDICFNLTMSNAIIHKLIISSHQVYSYCMSNISVHLSQNESILTAPQVCMINGFPLPCFVPRLITWMHKVSKNFTSHWRCHLIQDSVITFLRLPALLLRVQTIESRCLFIPVIRVFIGWSNSNMQKQWHIWVLSCWLL